MFVENRSIQSSSVKCTEKDKSVFLSFSFDWFIPLMLNLWLKCMHYVPNNLPNKCAIESSGNSNWSRPQCHFNWQCASVLNSTPSTNPSIIFTIRATRTMGLFKWWNEIDTIVSSIPDFLQPIVIDGERERGRGGVERNKWRECFYNPCSTHFIIDCECYVHFFLYE